jgi:hypothetical protein
MGLWVWMLASARAAQVCINKHTRWTWPAIYNPYYERMRAGTNNSGSDRRQDFVRRVETPRKPLIRRKLRYPEIGHKLVLAFCWVFLKF